METKKMPKNAKKFDCELCDFKCTKKTNYDIHLSTNKHLANKEGDKKQANFICNICKKEYKSRNGLWKHSKICVTKESNKTATHTFDDTSNEIKVLTNIVLEMVKNNNNLQQQHSNLQQQIIDICKNISNNTIINSNNKTFNLQVFLNEKCKDAMNMSEFVNSFNLQLSDLETVGELGYVVGTTKIFLEKLRSMDIYKRPIHCSDAKREIIYIKDENVWIKEEKDYPNLRKAIKNISFTPLDI